MLGRRFCRNRLCLDYWLLFGEALRLQLRKFEFEALAREKLQLKQEYESEIYFHHSGEDEKVAQSQPEAGSE